GYYMFRSTNSEAKTAARKHVLWIIKNHPEAPITGTPFCQIDAILDPDGFREAKQLWEDQIKAQSNDVNVIGHAAQFFLLADSARAEALSKQAQDLAPSDPAWPDHLGQLYALRWNKDGAKQALAEFEKAQAADQSEESKFARLDSLAKGAFEIGDFEKAAKYAN